MNMLVGTKNLNQNYKTKMADIIYKESYVSLDDVKAIKTFFDKKITDKLSGGPYQSKQLQSGMEGCWDRSLHFEIVENPIHNLVKKLKEDFGDFVIHESSIRHMAYPFVPHSDIRSSKWLQEQRQNYTAGYTFLIPLWWKQDYNPGTAFFSSPPKEHQELYIEQQDVLPVFSKEHSKQARNFGVEQIIKWKSKGDLVAWKNFQWHCSLSQKDYLYNDKNWCKEFISIETAIPKI